jgi:hypothetical protein
MDKNQPTISLIGTKVVHKQNISTTFCDLTIGSTYEVIVEALHLGLILILDDVNSLRWLPMQDFYLASKDESSSSTEAGVGDSILCISNWVDLTLGKTYTVLKHDIPYAKVTVLSDKGVEWGFPEHLFNMTKCSSQVSTGRPSEWEDDD